jgi:hypothetical protein
MTRDKKTGHYIGGNVTPITPDTQPFNAEDDALAKLKDLVAEAMAVRQAMDFCVSYISVDRLIAEGLLLEATDAFRQRKQCSWTDAREYVARVVAEREAAGVCLRPYTGVNHE